MNISVRLWPVHLSIQCSIGCRSLGVALQEGTHASKHTSRQASHHVFLVALVFIGSGSNTNTSSIGHNINNKKMNQQQQQCGQVNAVHAERIFSTPDVAAERHTLDDDGSIALLEPTQLMIMSLSALPFRLLECTHRLSMFSTKCQSKNTLSEEILLGNAMALETEGCVCVCSIYDEKSEENKFEKIKATTTMIRVRKRSQRTHSRRQTRQLAAMAHSQKAQLEEFARIAHNS